MTLLKVHFAYHRLARLKLLIVKRSSLQRKSMAGIITNCSILQIDVEDWYHDLSSKEWDLCEDRVVPNTNKVLDILREANVCATFFVLGYVAQRFPKLVERIKNENHEVATHGYAHIPITKQTPLEFEDDLINSIKILEGITGERVLGYRAPQFSIVKKTSWAIDILKKRGLRYDSSVFPTKTHLYGIPNARLFPYHISSSNIEDDELEREFWEVPLSVYRMPVLRKNIPIAGGFYLRFFPYSFIQFAIKRINELNQPAVCYLHPWELDPEQPRIDSLRWYHYYRLSSTERKFKKLLAQFRFTSVRRYFNLG